jgi:hypothetical protein
MHCDKRLYRIAPRASGNALGCSEEYRDIVDGLHVNHRPFDGARSGSQTVSLAAVPDPSTLCTGGPISVSNRILGLRESRAKEAHKMQPSLKGPMGRDG